MDHQPESINTASFVQRRANLPYGRVSIVVGHPQDAVGPGLDGLASAVASVAINGYSFTSREDMGEVLYLVATLGEPDPVEAIVGLEHLAEVLTRVLDRSLAEKLVTSTEALGEIMPLLNVVHAHIVSCNERIAAKRAATVDAQASEGGAR